MAANHTTKRYVKWNEYRSVYAAVRSKYPDYMKPPAIPDGRPVSLGVKLKWKGKTMQPGFYQVS